MAYSKLNLKNGTKLNQDHLAHIEAGIAANEAEFKNYQPKGDYALNSTPITVSGKSLTINDAISGQPLNFSAIGFTEAYGKSKNLFDLERASDFSNYITIELGGTVRRVLQFNLKPNTTYTYSRIKVEGLSRYQNMALYNSAGATKSTLNNAVTSMTTSDDGLLFLGTTATAFTQASQLTFITDYQEIQLEEGPSATSYEPFTDKSGIINAGNLNIETGRYEIILEDTNGIDVIEILLSLEKPLSKWDSLICKNGVWGISYCTANIEEYNNETIDSDFITPTGELVVGEPVQYKINEQFIEFNSELQTLLNSLKVWSSITKITNDSNLILSIEYSSNSEAKIIASSNYVNVKDYGALGDGEADDTKAIRVARDIAHLTKKPLYFPAGKYIITGCIQLYSDMHIIGEKGSLITKPEAIVQNLVKAGTVGDTSIQVSNASAYRIGQDIYIGANGSGNYADTVGYITEIDSTNNLVSFEVYPRHNANKNAGLARAVSTSGVISTSFPFFCTFREEDAGGNILIEGLTLDGNKLQSGEPNAYQLSLIHIDPNELNVTVKDCKVVNSNADGISVQNGGQTIVENCIIDTTGYHGIHPGFTIRGVAISNCFIYNCPNSGVYDCYDVDGLDITNCYFVNCLLGVGGLDENSNGSNIVACTFIDCNEGVKLTATLGGASVSGCSFQSCDTGVAGYVSGTAAINGCVFKDCNIAARFRNAYDMAFVGNVIKDCATPISCEIYENAGTIKYNSHLIIADNIISSSGTNTSKINAAYLNDTVISNNILKGNETNITVDIGTTTNIIVNNNIGEKVEIDSTVTIE